MIEHAVPPVSDEEWLARYLCYGRYIRADRTIRPEALTPHPHPNLSVTRHRNLDEAKIWQIGAGVALQTGTTLHGRGDLQAVDFRRETLAVIADPVENNPNHANVVDWPAEKARQKLLAQKIAIACRFVPPPATGK